MKMEESVPKRRYIKFRRRGITQKKGYKNQGIFLRKLVTVRKGQFGRYVKVGLVYVIP
jgi:hypothetical protein